MSANLSKLDELKRQQAKLDKITAEKCKLQAFLDYQEEMENEKKRKKIEVEKVQNLDYIYHINAIIIQKYSRVWLAKRHVQILKETRKLEISCSIESSHSNNWSNLNQALDQMQDMVRTCGTDSKERFIEAAIIIQKWVRGRLIRNLLKPYFSLFRKVSPLIEVFEKYSNILPKREGFYSLVINAAPEEVEDSQYEESKGNEDKSGIISQVDMSQEELIMRNMRKNENKFEIQIDKSSKDSIVEEENQTYKLIMSNQDASNHEGFSIEDDSEDGSDNSEEDEKYFDQWLTDKPGNILQNINIEPIVEEDGEESKYVPTPQKTVTSKMNGNQAVEWIKQLRNKELEKRLDGDWNSRIQKDFKSADVQKQKAILKDPKNLPPRVPNRSSTSNDNPLRSNQLKSYKKVPSSTKASSKAETLKSFQSMNPGQKKPIKKSTTNGSQISSEGGKLNPESWRALTLYETPTVASQYKKQGVFKQESSLPPWGIQSVNTKHAAGKKTLSVTTRSTVTPRRMAIKRGKTNVNCTALVVKEDPINKTQNHIQKDIKIRKNKKILSKQGPKNQWRHFLIF